MKLSRQGPTSTGTGRWAQKQRTRRAILQAAADLVADGTIPTVIQAAERAQVSQATAYRYFSSQESLLVEVTLPMAELREAFDRASQVDLPARVAAMVRAAAEWCYAHQTVLREMLRASLETGDGGYERPSHRRDWIDEALEPIRGDLEAASYRRIAAVLNLFVGIDPIIVMENMAELPRDEAIDALVWGATTLVGALDYAPRKRGGQGRQISAREA